MGDSNRSTPEKIQGESLVKRNAAQDVPGSTEAACRELTGCQRLEGESPLLRNKNALRFYLEVLLRKTSLPR